MRKKLAVAALALLILLAWWGKANAVKAWYGTDWGPWRSDFAPPQEVPALLRALEERGYEPRFVFPASTKSSESCRSLECDASGHCAIIDPPQCRSLIDTTSVQVVSKQQ